MKFVSLKEWIGLHEAIRFSFAGCVLPERTRVLQCSDEIYQATIAEECGFRVPDLCVTNHPDRVKEFHRRHERIVLKGLGRPLFPHKNVPTLTEAFMTQEVEKNDLASAGESEFHYCPHFFQEYIDKKYEFRIVVIGESIFSFKIDSQKYKSTSIDWRWGNETLNFILEDIDQRLKDMLVRFLEIVHLPWGSFDLVIDRDDHPWFLECNPQGQWGWLDNVVDGAISREKARFLAAVARSACAGTAAQVRGCRPVRE